MNGVKVRDRGFSVQADLKGLKGENIAALCDVNERVLAEASKQFPAAKTYTDWRRCLDQKDLDAVVCSTADHTHAFINLWAMNRGLSVYCEKPLTLTIAEGQSMVAAARDHKRIVQTGSQQRSDDRFRLACELVRSGRIGKVHTVRVGIAGRAGRDSAAHLAR